MDKRSKIIFVLILACLCLSSCKSEEPSFLENYRIEDEEYEVISAVINSECIGDKTQLVIIKEFPEFFVIYDNEEDMIAIPGVLKKGDALGKSYQKKMFLHEIGTDTFKDFERKIKYTPPWEYKFKIGRRYLLLNRQNDEDEEREPYRDFLSEFHLVYPGAKGIIYFSRVGLNKSKTKALVNFNFVYGALYGGGWFFYLKKINGTWIIMKRLGVWVS